MMMIASLVLGIALGGCQYGEKDCPGPGGCSVPAHRCFAEGARLVRDTIWIVLDDSGSDLDFRALRAKLKNMNRRNALIELRDALLEEGGQQPAVDRINRLLQNPKYQKWLERPDGLEGIAEFAKMLDKLVGQSERLQKPIEETRARLKPMAGLMQNDGNLKQIQQANADEATKRGARWVGDAIASVLDESNPQFAALRDTLKGQNMKQALEKLRDDLQSRGDGNESAQSIVKCINHILKEKGGDLEKINGIQGLREFGQELGKIAPSNGEDRTLTPSPGRTRLQANGAFDQALQTSQFSGQAAFGGKNSDQAADTAGVPFEQPWAMTGRDSKGQRTFGHGRNSEAAAVAMPEPTATGSKSVWERYLDRLPPDQKRETVEKEAVRVKALQTRVENPPKPPVEEPKPEAKPEETQRKQAVEETMLQKAKKKIGHSLRKMGEALQGMGEKVTGGEEKEGGHR